MAPGTEIGRWNQPHRLNQLVFIVSFTFLSLCGCGLVHGRTFQAMAGFAQRAGMRAGFASRRNDRRKRVNCRVTSA